jgi:hypothetical protein
MNQGIKQALTLALLLAPFGATGEESFVPSLEPHDAGVSITIDDDLFSGPGRDRDYTGGVTVTFSGTRAEHHPLSLDALLNRVDRHLNVGAAEVSHAIAFGVMAFTPQDVLASEPVFGDRPYASLAFVTSARRYVSTERDVVYHTALTVGVLGLDAVGSAHRAIHRLSASDPLRGYDHQISAGGEPTARYGFARQAPIGRPSGTKDLKWTASGSVGTVTEGSLSLNGRWGHIRSPWWTYTPEQSVYSREPQPLAPVAAAEAFVTAGAKVRVRAYNAFLQGQFRDSVVTYSAGELNPVLVEAWAGTALRRPSGVEIRYLARWSSPELRSGPGSRSILWGSLEFVKPFGD